MADQRNSERKIAGFLVDWISPARILIAFFGAGSAHLAGVFAGLSLDQFPLLNSSFVARVWWAFSIAAFQATIIAALAALVLFSLNTIGRIGISLFRPAYEFSPYEPLWITIASSIAWLLTFTNSYQFGVSDIVKGLLYSYIFLWLISLAFRAFNLYEKIPNHLLENLRSTPFKLGAISLGLLIILGIPYEAGRGLASQIMITQQFKVWEVGKQSSPYFAIVLDINSTGIFLRKCDEAGYPLLLPISQVLKVELGSDPWQFGCHISLEEFDIDSYADQ